MKKPKKIRISRFINKVLLLAFICIAAGTEHSYAQEGEVVDKIIAKVDDYIILKSELEAAYISFLTSDQARSFEGDPRCLILRNFLESKVMLVMADIDSVVLDDGRVDYELQGRMQRIIQQFGSEKAIQEAYGKTIDQFMDELRPNIEEQLRIQTQEQNILSEVSVTPSEVRKFYNQVPKDSLPIYNKEYEVGVIVKVPEPGLPEKQRVIDRLLNVRQRVLNGESFEILALDFSEGPSRTNGGNLGFAARGTMDPAYEAGALALKPGEISMPIESSFGIHLIQMIEKRGNEYNSRHIIIKPKPSPADIQKAEKALDSLRNEVMNETITFEEAARQYSDDQATKINGGFIIGPFGSNRVPSENLDPALFFALDEMKKGDISKPAKVQVSEDTHAVRIIYFKEEFPPHRANLSDDFEKLKAAATQMKKVQKRNEYLMQKMQEVYIQIDPEYNRCGIINY